MAITISGVTAEQLQNILKSVNTLGERSDVKIELTQPPASPEIPAAPAPEPEQKTEKQKHSEPQNPKKEKAKTEKAAETPVKTTAKRKPRENNVLTGMDLSRFGSNGERLVSTTEIADHISIARSTLTYHVRQGHLPEPCRIGNHYYWKLQELWDWGKEHLNWQGIPGFNAAAPKPPKIIRTRKSTVPLNKRMSMKETASFLGVTDETLTDLVRIGVLPTAAPSSSGEPFWTEDQILAAYDQLEKHQIQHKEEQN